MISDRWGFANSALTWATAIVIYLVMSYPYHAIVLTGIDVFPQAIYAGLCLLGFALFFVHRHSPLPVEYSRITWLFVVGLLFVMSMTLLTTRNPTVVRELLLLGLALLLLLRVRGVDCLMVMRALVYVSVIVLLPAMIIVAMFYAGFIDGPTWRVERLGLGETNPLMIRGTIGSAEYYLPWFLAFVPHMASFDQGFGLVFVRQPLVYIEPTDTWLYSAGLLWFAVADRTMPLRILCIAVLGLALAVSYSVAGILATVGAALVCVGVYVGGRTLVLAIVGGIAMLFSVLPLDFLLSLIAENKANQLEFYTDNLKVLSNPTLFGSADFAERQDVNYGMLSVIDRYGLVGFGFAVLALIAFALMAFHLLNDKENLGWKRFPLFVGSAVSLAMTAKYPGIVPAMPIMSLAAALSFRQFQMSPFTAAAIRP